MFSWQRFILVFRNDLLAQGNRLLLGGTAALVLGTLLFLSNLSDDTDPQEPLYLILFMFTLILGGGVFTSSLYHDIHHPQERYTALMLPIHATERFLSRWLLGGPLFLVYVLIFMQLLQFVTGLIGGALWDLRPQPFTFTYPVYHVVLAFVFGQALMQLGAIHFRSLHFGKTVLAGMLLWTLFALVLLTSLKLVYWDHFPSLFALQPDRRFYFEGPFSDASRHTILLLGIAIYLWLQFLAYSCLRDHEV